MTEMEVSENSGTSEDVAKVSDLTVGNNVSAGSSSRNNRTKVLSEELRRSLMNLDEERRKIELEIAELNEMLNNEIGECEG